MTIGILTVSFVVRVLFLGVGLVSSQKPSILNERNRDAFSETSNDLQTSRFSSDELKYPTAAPRRMFSDETLDNRTGPTTFSSDYSSESSSWPTSAFDSTISSDDDSTVVEERWFNVNQSHRRDPYRSVLFWKYISGDSATLSIESPDNCDTLRDCLGSARRSASYVLRSKPQCTRQACGVKLKYNGTLSSLRSGCLSFSIRTNGTPVGQLWIIEDQQPENSSQKLQITNKTLRVEHSLKSRTENLSIEARILFRNPDVDRITLSNLKVSWKGSCPKHRSAPTPSPDSSTEQSTSGDRPTLTSQGFYQFSTPAADEDLSINRQSSTPKSTTLSVRKQTRPQSSSSVLHENNVAWFLSLTGLFCSSVILSALGYGYWLVRQQSRLIWRLGLTPNVYLIARRSIRSSTRSDKNIPTISQIAYDMLHGDPKNEQRDIPTTNSNRSTPSSYYTYL